MDVIRRPILPPGSLERLCVFCGLRPNEKTVEHIIPRWLIEMTGPGGRIANLGVDWYRGTPRKFAFGRFTFPACDLCNQKYSKLEGEAKRTIHDLLDKDEATVVGIARLFDWFDKIRVGLWLGFRYLDKNYWNIRPHFHIDQRLGKYDRILSIYRDARREMRGISFFGVNTPIFSHMPSCFMLRINNMGFVNSSSIGLVAKQLGFPYPSDEPAEKTDLGTTIIIESGTGEISLPLYKACPPAGGYSLVQPMFRIEALGSESPYNTKYVREKSIDFDNGVGAIFSGDTAEMLQDSVSIQEREVDWKKIEDYTLKLQHRLWLDGSQMDPDMAANPEYRRIVAATQRKISKLPEQRRRLRRYRGPGKY